MTTKAKPAVEYLHAGTYTNPGEIYRVAEGWEPARRYSPVQLAQMFEAAPDLLRLLEQHLENTELDALNEPHLRALVTETWNVLNKARGAL